MRKLLVLPIVVSMFFIDFAASAAVARGTRGARSTSGETTGTAPVAARAAAVRSAKTASTTTAQPAKQNTAVAAARAATRTTPKTTTNVSSAGGNVAARAGAKQKVISMGTKISTATANTIVDQECQNAYFGCMDSFCMLENVTGGRCKCSDKNEEYNGILAEIMKLDQQSYVMQSEGVSLLKMGKSADEVYAMAEEAANKVTTKKTDTSAEKKKLDLSAWNKSYFDDDDEVFEDEDVFALDSDLTSKTGDKLHATAASICTQQIPAQCKASGPMLRMIYVQKIQSDCAAYENSLKQQQLESTQKMQTARQALRDTALEKYQEANKYDLGGCVRAFSSCMQTEETCGEGYLGCVRFAASDNLKNNKNGTVAQQTPINMGYSVITLASTTMDELVSKRVLCGSILEQCVKANENDAVWTAFLKSAAPTIKTAESDAESNLRMNCISEVSQCFQTACKEQMDVNNPDGSFDMCLSNPDLYKSLCKPKLEPCLLATGGTFEKPEDSALWTGLKARLASMKVDACTKEVKDCLLSDERCGKDYSGCIGLSTYQITRLCPADKLTACMENNNNDEDAVYSYVAQVGQGIALNIDNKMYSHCQSALKTAMLTYCGAEDTCPNAQIDENFFKNTMHVRLCKKDGSNCSPDAYSFTSSEVINGEVIPMLTDRVDVSSIFYEVNNNPTAVFGTANTDNGKTFNSVTLGKLVKTLNTAYSNLLKTVESDPKVVYCMSGRAVQGFDKDGWLSGVGEEDKKGRFPNLTDTIRNAIAQNLLNSVLPVYADTQEQVINDEFAAMNQNLNTRINEFVQMTQEKQHTINQNACEQMVTMYGEDYKPRFGTGSSGKRQSTWGAYADYDKSTSVCTITKRRWECDYWLTPYCWRWKTGMEDSSIEAEKKIFMPTVSRASIRENIKGNGLTQDPTKDLKTTTTTQDGRADVVYDEG